MGVDIATNKTAPMLTISQKEVNKMEDIIYSLKVEDVIDKIAEYEAEQEYGIARGIYIAAHIAGIDITSEYFYTSIQEKTKKYSRKKLRSRP